MNAREAKRFAKIIAASNAEGEAAKAKPFGEAELLQEIDRRIEAAKLSLEAFAKAFSEDAAYAFIWKSENALRQAGEAYAWGKLRGWLIAWQQDEGETFLGRKLSSFAEFSAYAIKHFREEAIRHFISRGGYSDAFARGMENEKARASYAIAEWLEWLEARLKS